MKKVKSHHNSNKNKSKVLQADLNRKTDKDVNFNSMITSYDEYFNQNELTKVMNLKSYVNR